ncbi:hypothetical protein CJU94_26975 [Paraburkholderia aromaticivorans]|uniref:Uncharacterized protein n=1 Tax=Paraburkholderia aromaticivorans TaxID=2026199 RepID=A0A248VTV0_9BURK|nr:hypothetical protein CJU94_26975 [Paraburkholderia aromaticivorans]
MTYILAILWKLCFAWSLIYLVTSLRTAFWISRRRGSGLIFLELHPGRAIGKTETAKARSLRRMGFSATVSMLLGITSWLIAQATS